MELLIYYKDLRDNEVHTHKESFNPHDEPRDAAQKRLDRGFIRRDGVVSTLVAPSRILQITWQEVDT